MPAFRRIALIGKFQSPEITESLHALAGFLREQGCDVMIEQETASNIGAAARSASYAEIGASADLAVIVGGDGTMLAAARNLVRYRVPVVGINQGRLGFMTDIALHDMRKSLGAILGGDYSMEERSLIDAEIVRDGKVLLQTLALNDAVVNKGSQGRLIEFEVHIDGQYVYTQRSDGVIVATPTGSTAYALSAQGPILHPSLPAFALVPLYPHTLSARPVSVSDRSTIEIVLLHAGRRPRPFRRPGAGRHGRGRPPAPEALRKRDPLRASARLQLFRHAAREAALERVDRQSPALMLRSLAIRDFVIVDAVELEPARDSPSSPAKPARASRSSSMPLSSWSADAPRPAWCAKAPNARSSRRSSKSPQAAASPPISRRTNSRATRACCSCAA